MNEIESAGSGKSQPCADLVMFLAYSGSISFPAQMALDSVVWADNRPFRISAHETPPKKGIIAFFDSYAWSFNTLGLEEAGRH